MREKLRLRAWAGPLTIGSFAVVAVTGVLMFFHAATGFSKVAHEWLGWLLVIGAVAHTALNWKPFVAYFRKPAALAIIVVLLILGLASLVASPGGGPGGHGPRAFMAVADALETSSLRVIAQVAKTSPETIVEKLTTQGLKVRGPEQTIREIASENGARGIEILSQLLSTGVTASPGRSRG
jgi:hypothetical protein